MKRFFWGLTMRLEKIKLSPELYDFSPEQKLLIKSRLYFYREGVGLGSKTVRSWRKIASDISNLAELPDLSVNEKNIIKERYQYYLITQSRRGKNELSDKEIIEGAFNIGADSLNRWYLGQNNRQKPGTKKPYQPTAQIIAAVRDFLLIKKYLLPTELHSDDQSIAFISSLNDFANYNFEETKELIPEFFHSYLSYTLHNNAFKTKTVQFETIKKAGYIRFVNEVRTFNIEDRLSLKVMLEKSAVMTANKMENQTGYLALGMLPSLIAFVAKTKCGERSILNWHVTLSSVAQNKAKFIKFQDTRSYSVEDERILPFRPQNAVSTYIYSKYEDIFDYFDESIYTNKNSIDKVSFFQRSNSVGVLVHNEEDIQSGIALYKEVCNLAYEFDGSDEDYLIPIKMIEQGANVNYAENNFSTLHVAAQCGLSRIIYAIAQREDLNYLVKDNQGLLPSDWAFRVSDELGQFLSEKQNEQAIKQGVDLSKLLSTTDLKSHPRPDFC